MKIKQFFPALFILVSVIIGFYPIFLSGKLPIPADTIVGLYHPYRDLYAAEYPRGIPFKNSLITDPVRQQYPWKNLAISIEKQMQIPLWNSYTFAGSPLLGNFQSSVFSPFNLLFFLMPFSYAWSLLIFFQPLLAAVFLYFYLIHLSLDKKAAFLGSIVFAFCGFSTSWLEWGNIVQTALWLPLILLSIDKIFIHKYRENIFITSYLIKWYVIFLMSLSFAFFAGHLQVFFYLFVFSLTYLVARWFQYGHTLKKLGVFFLLYFFFFLITAVQSIPTLLFIMNSARAVDQTHWQEAGWFLPWQNLIQFVIPDFFGNPSTLNYWGIWNYGEFIGYIGIFPLIMALYALFFRHDRKTLFFGCIVFISLIFTLPTIFAKIPYILSIPFLSTSQPTRLLFLIDFSLSVLVALGLDMFLKKKGKIIFILLFLGFVYFLLFAFITLYPGSHILPKNNLLVSRQNSILPILLFATFAFMIGIEIFLEKKEKIYWNILTIIPYVLIVLTVAELLRFNWKYTPFVVKQYLYPTTHAIEFLKNHLGNSRYMSTDSRIFPPNFPVMYQLQSVDGYDPLYLRNYAEFMAALGRDKPDINPPFGFNRIITPQNYKSFLIDILGVKYILSFDELHDTKLTKVFQEGKTNIYENTDSFPRAFFVNTIEAVHTKQEAIQLMFTLNNNLIDSAVIQISSNESFPSTQVIKGNVTIVNYASNNITLKTDNAGDGFLVFTDNYYPSWHAKICSINSTSCSDTKIYLTDYTFRGIRVPNGEHTIVFYQTLF